MNAVARNLVAAVACGFTCTLLLPKLAQAAETLVQGTVTDQGTGQPIAGAVVALSGGGIALTDPAGNYTIVAQQGVPTSGVLDIRKPGYFYSNPTYDLSGGSLVTVNASLIHGGTIVQGTVNDANTGLPIGNANLFLNELASAVTGADGRYTVDASKISETRAGGFAIEAGTVNATGYFDFNLGLLPPTQIDPPYPGTLDIALVRRPTSALGMAAAPLQPGQWTTIATTDIRPVLSGGGSSNNIITFAENLLWDSVTRQIYYVGSDHGAKTKFVTYSEDTNKWVHEPDAPWFANWSGTPLAEHGYRQAIDTGVAVYRRRGGKQMYSRVVWRYDLTNKSWTELPPFPTTVNDYTSVAPGMAYFPERNSIVMVQVGSPFQVFEYDTAANTWRGLAQAVVGSYHNSTEYNPVHKVVLIAGGVYQPRVMYKLDAAGTVTRLQDAPAAIELGVNRSIIAADPVSGDFIILSGNLAFKYDIVTDTWTTLPPSPVTPTSIGGTVAGAIGVPISTYGVIGYVACGKGTSPCVTHLYRHAAASGTPTLVQGTVTDQGTGQPIAGAVVAISGDGIAMTNTAGNYTIAAQPGVPMTGVLDIRKPGYFYSNPTYDLSGGTLVTVNAALIHGGTVVQGAMTDANTGLPIGNANLFLNGLASAVTGADGRYTVDASQISETQASGFTIDAGAVNAAGYFDINLSLPPPTQINPPYPGTLNLQMVSNGVTQTVSFATNPPGLQITVDGTTYTTPQIFAWQPSNPHTVSTSSLQAGTPGTRYLFQNWSNGGGQSQTIVAPADAGTFTAMFKTQFLLITAVDPEGAGTVTVGDWFDAGSNVSVAASAASGYVFDRFSGDLAGSTNPQLLSIAAPRSVTAHFVPLAQPTTTALQASANPAPFGSAVTLTATVTGNSPTGTVAFNDGASTISSCGTVPLVSGAAQCVVSGLAVGSHSITAVYSGDASNASSTSPALSLSVVSADTTPPAVVSLARAVPSPTMADAVDFTLTFSEPVSGVAANNFEVVASGITGTSVGAIAGAGATWTVTVSTGRGTGSLHLDVVDGSGIVDGAGNALEGTPFTGETYEVDKGGTVIGVGQGQPVAGFGSAGYALFSDVQTVRSPTAIVALADGRVLAAGGVDCDISTGNNCTLQLGRYSTSGAPDASFGTNGRVLTAVTSVNSDLNASIVDGDGTVIVTGSRNNGSAEVPFVAKFTSAGTPVSTFGNNGLASLDSLPMGSGNSESAIDGLGRIVIVSTTPDVAPEGNDIFVTRLAANGAPDSTFGNGGVVELAISTTGTRHDHGTAVAVQSDSKILVGGRTIGASGLGFDFLLMRLNADGTLDSSFGTSGVTTTRFNSSTGGNFGRGLAQQSDGKIVLIGDVTVDADLQCGIARFSADGTLDGAFGGGGKVLEPVTLGCHGVALQPDGKVVVTAMDSNADVSYGTFIRLLATGMSDSEFGTDGMLHISSYDAPARVAFAVSGNLVSGLVIQDPTDGVLKAYVIELASQLVQPMITTFSPPSGAIGTSVTITGTNFTGASSITFNGSSATYVVDSASQITATVPAGATSGAIAVTTPAGTATSAATFTVILGPTITSFSPASGAVGASVTITGTSFTGASSVTFNGSSATYVVDSASQITATVPTGATSGPIAVTTPAGTATSAATFTVIVAPTITSFSPTSGAVGASVTITGTSFTGASSVTFNGSSATYVVDSASQITATVPAGATSGAIAVTTPAGTATSAATFTVILGPTITSFSPTSGAVGASVTITGTNFTGASSVTFNGSSATYIVNSASQITASVPAGATSGAIAVTTPAGTATSAATFTVILGPTITSFSPTSGAVGASVTITGTSFTGASSVTFNGSSATYVVDSASQITATVPTGATSGAIAVTTPAGTVTSAATFTVIVAPTITSFSPTSGAVGASVTITGTSFTGASSVTFNGSSATYVVNSASQIIATVPAGATSGAIAVTTPAGTATSAATFTVIVPPTITSFSPTSGTVGAAVTITGTNFTGASSVTFNGSSATYIVNSASQITASVPTGGTSGAIAVTTPAGTATSAATFTVILGPTITSFSPTSGAVGASVTITGTNFAGATVVTFNGTSAAFKTVGSSKINTTVPAGATSGAIAVITPAGTATSAAAFTVVLAPTITGFSPPSGAVGTIVTITGVNFTGATRVTFNGKSATYTVVSSTQITSRVPSGAKTGPLSVATPGGTTTSASSFSVTQ